MTRRRVVWVLFALSGVLPLFLLFLSPPQPVPLIYSVFVLTCLVVHPPVDLAFFFVFWAAGLFIEATAWYGDYTWCNPNPGLFHPQLFPDLIRGSALYISWGLAWLLLLRRYPFTLREAYVTHGLYGVLAERQGAVFIQGLATMPAGIVLWLYIFVVYGSTLGVPYRLFGHRLHRAGTHSRPWKYPAAILLIFALGIPLPFLFERLFDAFGGLPPPGPICERPFW